MKIPIYKTDYKGKWYTYSDVPDTIYESELETIDTEYFIFLCQHVINCRYYGIPPYIGTNEKLNKIFDLLEQAYELGND